jgi:two-component system, NtrC family, sensor kinase
MPHDAPAAQPGKSATPLRRELFLAFGVLFGGAILVATLGLLMVLPVLRSAGETTFFIVCLLAADLSILFVFGRAVLQRSLLDPMDRLVADAGRIAGGDYEHRVRIAETRELQSLSLNMNAMADRLIREQRLLEKNVRSLDGTNRELVEATDQVIRTARLASVGTLAAGIAHEIGNPLGAIMGYVDVAKRRAREGGDVTGALEATAEEARRIDRIVQSLLDYARPDRVPEGPVAIDARALVERVHSLLEAQGQLAGIAVESTVDDDVPDLQGNPHHLEQILVNLFLNAVDALEGRKDRRIECRVTRELRDGRLLRARREGDPPGTNYAHRRRKPSRPPIADESSGSYAAREKIPSVVFTVRDNGPGIPDDAGDNIFDPFFTTKEPGKGTGLGLSICARLVHGMGGGIRGENAAGGGAAFSVSIPIAPGSLVAGKGDDLQPMADAANEGRPAAEGAASARDSDTRTGML